MKLIKDIAISENGLVFNPISGDSFKVNEIALKILNYMRMDMESDEIILKICQEYDVESKTIELDYNDFINTLNRNMLLEFSGKHFKIND